MDKHGLEEVADTTSRSTTPRNKREKQIDTTQIKQDKREHNKISTLYYARSQEADTSASDIAALAHDSQAQLTR